MGVEVEEHLERLLANPTSLLSTEQEVGE